MNNEKASDQNTTETTAGRILTGGNVYSHLRFGNDGKPFLKGIVLAPGITLDVRAEVVTVRPSDQCVGGTVHDGNIEFVRRAVDAVDEATFKAAVSNLHQSIPDQERAGLNGLYRFCVDWKTRRWQSVTPTMAKEVTSLYTYAIHQPGTETGVESSRSIRFSMGLLVQQSNRAGVRAIGSHTGKDESPRLIGLALQASTVEDEAGGQVTVYSPDGYLVHIPPMVKTGKDEKGNPTAHVLRSGHFLLVPQAEVSGFDLFGAIMTAIEDATAVFEAIDARGKEVDEEPVPTYLVDAQDVVDEAQVEFEKAETALKVALKKLHAARKQQRRERWDRTKLTSYLAAALGCSVEDILGAQAEPADEASDDQPPPDAPEKVSSEDETGEEPPPDEADAEVAPA